MGNFIIIFLPFVFVLMGIYILFELIRINKILNMWELNSLMLIPILYCILYSYIGIYEPTIEIARLLSRLVLTTSLGISTHIVYAYSKKIRQGRSH